MFQSYLKKSHRGIMRLGNNAIISALILSIILCPTTTYAKVGLNLPVPGTMVPVSNGLVPAVLKGIKVYPTEPFRFDFIVDTGESGLEGAPLNAESQKLIKYFLAALTTPEKDLWVNLSPYEKDRIVPNEFGITEMGRDLLGQDYLLKQLSASLLYPESELGRQFWQKIYKTAYEKFGTTDIPINTFNKVWIVPKSAKIFTKDNTAYVVGCDLKVMLDEDYLSLQKNLSSEEFKTKDLPAGDVQEVNQMSSQVIRELIIPVIEKEVNEGQNFAQLRQVYHSLILAVWYKQNMRQSIMQSLYIDKAKVKGIAVDDREVKQKIYEQYLEAFQKGVYSYIKEEVSPGSDSSLPRKYFSGGMNLMNIKDIIAKVGSETGITARGKLISNEVTLVPHRVVNKYIFDHLPEGLKQDKAKISQYALVQNGQVQSRLVPIPGLLKATGQFAHIGLGQTYGIPVIYIDEDYASDEAVRLHELDEITQWEALRRMLGKQPQEMSRWIQENFVYAEQLRDTFHNNSRNIDPLFVEARRQGMLPSRTAVEELYPEELELAQTEKSINIAAGGSAAYDFHITTEELLKENKGLVIADNSDAVAHELSQAAKAQGRDFLLIRPRNKTDLDRLKSAIRVNPDGSYEHVDGPLRRTLKDSKEAIILIDYNGSAPNLAGGFHRMFDDDPGYADLKLNKNIKVYGVVSDRQVDRFDSSFTSRLRHRALKMDYQDPVDRLPIKNIPQNAVKVDLNETPFARELLLGTYDIGPNGEILVIPGQLNNAKKDTAIVLRGGDFKDPSFRDLIRQFIENPAQEFNMETIVIPDGVKIYREDVDFSKGVSQKKLVAWKEMPDEGDQVWIINKQTQDFLFKRNHIDNVREENQLTRQAGILDLLKTPKQLKNQRVRLAVTSHLDDWVWHAIMHTDGNIIIEVAPWVPVPKAYLKLRSKALKTQSNERKLSEWEDVKEKKSILVESKDLEFALRTIESSYDPDEFVVYPVTAETTVNQLFEFPDFSSTEGKRKYTSSSQEIYEKLLQGKTVVLVGTEHNKVLCQGLESALQEDPYIMVNGMRVDLPGRLIVLQKPLAQESSTAVNQVSMNPNDALMEMMLQDDEEIKASFNRGDYQKIIKLRDMFNQLDGINREEVNFNLYRLRLLFKYVGLGYTWLEAFEQVVISKFAEDQELVSYMRVMVRLIFDVEEREFTLDGDKKRNEKSLHGKRLKRILQKTVYPVRWDRYFWEFVDTLSLDLLNQIQAKLGTDFRAPKFDAQNPDEIEQFLRGFKKMLGTDSQMATGAAVHKMIRTALIKHFDDRNDTEHADFYRKKFALYAATDEWEQEVIGATVVPSIDFETNAGEDTWEYRERMAGAALFINNAVMFQGPPASGKSHLAQILAAKNYQPNEIFRLTVGNDAKEEHVISRRVYQQDEKNNESNPIVDEAIAKWAKSEKGILIVDEANLTEPYFWNFLRGFFSKNPHMYLDGRYQDLKDKKIIFTGNQDSLVGRKLQELIDEYMVTIFFKPFKRSDIERIMREQEYLPEKTFWKDQLETLILDLHFLFNRMNPNLGFALREVQDLAQRVNFLYPNGWTENEVIDLAWQIYGGSFNREEREALHHILAQKYGVEMLTKQEGAMIEKVMRQTGEVLKIDDSDKPLIMTDSTALMIHDEMTMLDLREVRIDAVSNNQKVLQGKMGMITDGAPGRAKDVALIKALRLKGYQEVQYSNTPINLADINQKRFYVINAQPDNADYLVKVIERARQEGAVVIIREMNLLPTDFLEGKLNEVTREAGAGFLVFATINSMDFSGRQQLSTALLNRIVYRRVYDYTQKELKVLAERWVNYSISETKDRPVMLEACNYVIQTYVWLRANIADVKHRPTFRELDYIMASLLEQYKNLGSAEFARQSNSLTESLIAHTYGPLYIAKFLKIPLAPKRERTRFQEKEYNDTEFLERLAGFFIPTALGQPKFAIIANKPDHPGGEFLVSEDEDGEVSSQIAMYANMFGDPYFTEKFMYETMRGLLHRDVQPWAPYQAGLEVVPLLKNIEDVRYEEALRHYLPRTNLGKPSAAEKEFAAMVYNRNTKQLKEWMTRPHDSLNHRRIFQLCLLVFSRGLLEGLDDEHGEPMSVKDLFLIFAKDLEFKDGGAHIYGEESNPIRLAIDHFETMTELKLTFPRGSFEGELDEEEIQFQTYRAENLIREIQETMLMIEGDRVPDPPKLPISPEREQQERDRAMANLEVSLESGHENPTFTEEETPITRDPDLTPEKREQMKTEIRQEEEWVRKADMEYLIDQLEEMWAYLMSRDTRVTKKDLMIMEHRLKDQLAYRSLVPLINKFCRVNEDRVTENVEKAFVQSWVKALSMRLAMVRFALAQDPQTVKEIRKQLRKERRTELKQMTPDEKKADFREKANERQRRRRKLIKLEKKVENREPLTEEDLEFLHNLPAGLRFKKGFGNNGEDAESEKIKPPQTPYHNVYQFNPDPVKANPQIVKPKSPVIVTKKVSYRRGQQESSQRDPKMQQLSHNIVRELQAILESSYVDRRPQQSDEFGADGRPSLERLLQGFPFAQCFIKSAPQSQEIKKTIVIFGEIEKYKNSPICKEFIYLLQEFGFSIEFVEGAAQSKEEIEKNLSDANPDKTYEAVDIVELQKQVASAYTAAAFKETARESEEKKQAQAPVEVREEEAIPTPAVTAAETSVEQKSVEGELDLNQQLDLLERFDEQHKDKSGESIFDIFEYGRVFQPVGYSIFLKIKVTTDNHLKAFNKLDLAKLTMVTEVELEGEGLVGLFELFKLENLTEFTFKPIVQLDPGIKRGLIRFLFRHLNHEDLKIILPSGEELIFSELLHYEEFHDMIKDAVNEDFEKVKKIISRMTELPAGTIVPRLTDNGNSIAITVNSFTGPLPDLSAICRVNYVKTIVFSEISRFTDLANFQKLSGSKKSMQLDFDYDKNLQDISFLSEFDLKDFSSINLSGTGVTDISPLFGKAWVAVLDLNQVSGISEKQVYQFYIRHPDQAMRVLNQVLNLSFGSSEFSSFLNTYRDKISQQLEDDRLEVNMALEQNHLGGIALTAVSLNENEAFVDVYFGSLPVDDPNIKNFIKGLRPAVAASLRLEFETITELREFTDYRECLKAIEREAGLGTVKEESAKKSVSPLVTWDFSTREGQLAYLQSFITKHKNDFPDAMVARVSNEEGIYLATTVTPQNLALFRDLEFEKLTLLTHVKIGCDNFQDVVDRFLKLENLTKVGLRTANPLDESAEKAVVNLLVNHNNHEALGIVLNGGQEIKHEGLSKLDGPFQHVLPTWVDDEIVKAIDQQFKIAQEELDKISGFPRGAIKVEHDLKGIKIQVDLEKGSLPDLTPLYRLSYVSAIDIRYPSKLDLTELAKLNAHKGGVRLYFGKDPDFNDISILENLNLNDASVDILGTGVTNITPLFGHPIKALRINSDVPVKQVWQLWTRYPAFHRPIIVITEAIIGTSKSRHIMKEEMSTYYEEHKKEIEEEFQQDTQAVKWYFKGKKDGGGMKNVENVRIFASPSEGYVDVAFQSGSPLAEQEIKGFINGLNPTDAPSLRITMPDGTVFTDYRECLKAIEQGAATGPVAEQRSETEEPVAPVEPPISEVAGAELPIIKQFEILMEFREKFRKDFEYFTPDLIATSPEDGYLRLRVKVTSKNIDIFRQLDFAKLTLLKEVEIAFDDLDAVYALVKLDNLTKLTLISNNPIDEKAVAKFLINHNNHERLRIDLPGSFTYTFLGLKLHSDQRYPSQEWVHEQIEEAVNHQLKIAQRELAKIPGLPDGSVRLQVNKEMIQINVELTEGRLPDLSAIYRLGYFGILNVEYPSRLDLSEISKWNVHRGNKTLLLSNDPQLTDISFLERVDLDQATISLSGTGVTNIAPLFGCPIQELFIDSQVSAKQVLQLWTRYPDIGRSQFNLMFSFVDKFILHISFPNQEIKIADEESMAKYTKQHSQEIAKGMRLDAAELDLLLISIIDEGNTPSARGINVRSDKDGFVDMTLPKIKPLTNQEITRIIRLLPPSIAASLRIIMPDGRVFADYRECLKALAQEEVTTQVSAPNQKPELSVEEQKNQLFELFSGILNGFGSDRVVDFQDDTFPKGAGIVLSLMHLKGVGDIFHPSSKASQAIRSTSFHNVGIVELDNTDVEYLDGLLNFKNLKLLSLKNLLPGAVSVDQIKAFLRVHSNRKNLRILMPDDKQLTLADLEREGQVVEAQVEVQMPAEEKISATGPEGIAQFNILSDFSKEHGSEFALFVPSLKHISTGEPYFSLQVDVTEENYDTFATFAQNEFAKLSLLTEVDIKIKVEQADRLDPLLSLENLTRLKLRQEMPNEFLVNLLMRHKNREKLEIELSDGRKIWWPVATSSKNQAAQQTETSAKRAQPSEEESTNNFLQRERLAVYLAGRIIGFDPHRVALWNGSYLVLDLHGLSNYDLHQIEDRAFSDYPALEAVDLSEAEPMDLNFLYSARNLKEISFKGLKKTSSSIGEEDIKKFLARHPNRWFLKVVMPDESELDFKSLDQKSKAGVCKEAERNIVARLRNQGMVELADFSVHETEGSVVLVLKRIPSAADLSVLNDIIPLDKIKINFDASSERGKLALRQIGKNKNIRNVQFDSKANPNSLDLQQIVEDFPNLYVLGLPKTANDLSPCLQLKYLRQLLLYRGEALSLQGMDDFYRQRPDMKLCLLPSSWNSGLVDYKDYQDFIAKNEGQLSELAGTQDELPLGKALDSSPAEEISSQKQRLADYLASVIPGFDKGNVAPLPRIDRSQSLAVDLFDQPVAVLRQIESNAFVDFPDLEWVGLATANVDPTVLATFYSAHNLRVISFKGSLPSRASLKNIKYFLAHHPNRQFLQIFLPDGSELNFGSLEEDYKTEAVKEAKKDIVDKLKGQGMQEGTDFSVDETDEGSVVLVLKSPPSNKDLTGSLTGVSLRASLSVLQDVLRLDEVKINFDASTERGKRALSSLGLNRNIRDIQIDDASNPNPLDLNQIVEFFPNLYDLVLHKAANDLSPCLRLKYLKSLSVYLGQGLSLEDIAQFYQQRPNLQLTFFLPSGDEFTMESYDRFMAEYGDRIKPEEASNLNPESAEQAVNDNNPQKYYLIGLLAAAIGGFDSYRIRFREDVGEGNKELLLDLSGMSARDLGKIKRRALINSPALTKVDLSASALNDLDFLYGAYNLTAVDLSNLLPGSVTEEDIRRFLAHHPNRMMLKVKMPDGREWKLANLDPSFVEEVRQEAMQNIRQKLTEGSSLVFDQNFSITAESGLGGYVILKIKKPPVTTDGSANVDLGVLSDDLRLDQVIVEFSSVDAKDYQSLRALATNKNVGFLTFSAPVLTGDFSFLEDFDAIISLDLAKSGIRDLSPILRCANLRTLTLPWDGSLTIEQINEFYQQRPNLNINLRDETDHSGFKYFYGSYESFLKANQNQLSGQKSPAKVEEKSQPSTVSAAGLEETQPTNWLETIDDQADYLFDSGLVTPTAIHFDDDNRPYIAAEFKITPENYKKFSELPFERLTFLKRIDMGTSTFSKDGDFRPLLGARHLRYLDLSRMNTVDNSRDFATSDLLLWHVNQDNLIIVPAAGMEFGIEGIVDSAVDKVIAFQSITAKEILKELGLRPDQADVHIQPGKKSGKKELPYLALVLKNVTTIPDLSKLNHLSFLKQVILRNASLIVDYGHLRDLNEFQQLKILTVDDPQATELPCLQGVDVFELELNTPKLQSLYHLNGNVIRILDLQNTNVPSHQILHLCRAHPLRKDFTLQPPRKKWVLKGVDEIEKFFEREIQVVIDLQSALKHYVENLGRLYSIPSGDVKGTLTHVAGSIVVDFSKIPSTKTLTLTNALKALVDHPYPEVFQLKTFDSGGVVTDVRERIDAMKREEQELSPALLSPAPQDEQARALQRLADMNAQMESFTKQAAAVRAFFGPDQMIKGFMELSQPFQTIGLHFDGQVPSLQPLSQIPDLKKMFMIWDEENLKELRHVPQLRELTIYGLEAGGLEFLSPLQELRHLVFTSDEQIDLELLNDLKKLQVVKITSAYCTIEQVKQLLETHPNGEHMIVILNGLMYTRGGQMPNFPSSGKNTLYGQVAKVGYFMGANFSKEKFMSINVPAIEQTKRIDLDLQHDKNGQAIKHSLTNMDKLKGLPNLYSLKVNASIFSTGQLGFEDLVSLRHFELKGNGTLTLKTIPPMENIIYLNLEFDAVDGNLNSLNSMPNLTYLGIHLEDSMSGRDDLYRFMAQHPNGRNMVVFVNDKFTVTYDDVPDEYKKTGEEELSAEVKPFSSELPELKELSLPEQIALAKEILQRSHMPLTDETLSTFKDTDGTTVIKLDLTKSKPSGESLYLKDLHKLRNLASVALPTMVGNYLRLVIHTCEWPRLKELILTEDQTVGWDFGFVAYLIIAIHPRGKELTIKNGNKAAITYEDVSKQVIGEIGSGFSLDHQLSFLKHIGIVHNVSNHFIRGPDDTFSLDLSQVNPKDLRIEFLRQIKRIKTLRLPFMKFNDRLISILEALPNLQVIEMTSGELIPEMRQSIAELFKRIDRADLELRIDGQKPLTRADMTPEFLGVAAAPVVIQQEEAAEPIEVNAFLVNLLNSLVDVELTLQQVREQFKDEGEEKIFHRVLMGLMDARGIDARVQAGAGKMYNKMLRNDAFFLSKTESEPMNLNTSVEIIPSVMLHPGWQNSPEAQIPGGIDLDPSLIQMQVEGEGIDLQVTDSAEGLSQIPIEGFTPVITHTVPITNLPLFLGISPQPVTPEEVALHQ